MSGGAVVFMKGRGARASLPAPRSPSPPAAHPTVARSGSFRWCQPVPKTHSNPDVQRQGFGCDSRCHGVSGCRCRWPMTRSARRWFAAKASATRDANWYSEIGVSMGDKR